MKNISSKYKNIFSENTSKPNWAVKKNNNKQELVHPSIPFIGKDYKNSKVLLYASAENLSDYKNHLDNDNFAINRHRNFFDTSSRNSTFPSVHIEPINCGALIIVTAYILKELELNLNYKDAFEFLEHIAFANFGKFSIDGDKNKDYADNLSKLKSSFKYVKCDLEELQPEVLILPNTIFKHKEVLKLISGILPNCRVIPIYQMNPRNINIQIATKHPKKTASDIDDLLLQWQRKLSNGITGKTNQNFYSVYSYLDDIIKRNK